MTDHPNDYETANEPVTDISTDGYGPQYTVDEDNTEKSPTPEVTDHVEQPTPEDKEEATSEEDRQSVKSLATDAPTSNNTTMTFPVYVTIPKRMLKAVPLRLHSRRFSRVSEGMKEWAQITGKGDEDPKMGYYVDAYVDASEMSLGMTTHEDPKMGYKGWFEDTLSDQTADWRQGILDENGNVVPPTRAPRQTNNQRNLGVGTSKERTLNALGIGLGLRVQLASTGITLGFSSPTGADLAGLNYALMLEKKQSGLTTEGMIFSNIQYGRIAKMWDFAQKYLIFTNLQNWNEFDLGDVVRCTDIPLIEWALACAIYPDGYPLEIPCGNDPSVCNHIEKINLDIYRTIWYNNSKLTKDQRKQLLNSRTNYPISAVENYQTSEGSAINKTFTAAAGNGSNFKFTCRIPTINEYIRAGEEWIASADQMMDGIFDRSKVSAKTREKFIEEQTIHTTLRGYSPWINTITINDLETIDTPPAICESLEALSNDEELTGVILNEIQKFIERAIVAVIALPTNECSICGYDASTEASNEHPELTPIDPMKLFFELGDRRLISLQVGLTN